MLLSVAVVALTTLNVAGVSAVGRIDQGGSKTLPPSVNGVLGSNGYLIMAIIGIVIAVAAVLLIIKFVLPRVRQNK